MKRTLSGMTENYEQVLMCLICRNLFDDADHQPKFLPCHHTFCKECLREYVRQMGDEIECPSCRKIATIPAAGVPALQTNFYVKYIESLVNSGRGQVDSKKACVHHDQEKAIVYCEECQVILCKKCSSIASNCGSHKKVSLTTVIEKSHQKLDQAFSQANNTIEHKKLMVEGMLKCLAEEKDNSLLKIESTFEQHIHALTRRSTLLKNKVIDIYKEHTQQLEDDLEEISTALTCIVSLKEYHEEKISQGDFSQFTSGIAEIKEVDGNTAEKIRPQEVHITFQDKHGIEKFRPGVKDLGRVKYTRPLIARSEPEGNDCEDTKSVIPTVALDNTSNIDVNNDSINYVKPTKQPSDLLNNNGNTIKSSECTKLNDYKDVVDGKLKECSVDVRPKTLPLSIPISKNTPLIEENVKESKIITKMASNISSLTDDEKVKVEKQYYHTVYTSYDEEELLKEFKANENSENCWQDSISSDDEPDEGTTSSASTIEDTQINE